MILDVASLPDDGRPLLLIDVDGVLNIASRTQNHKRYNIFKASGFWIRIWREVPNLLDRLTDHFVPVWCTMWDDLANTELAPRLDLPSLPYIPCWDNSHTVPLWGEVMVHHKIPAIVKHVGSRAIAWIDDEIGKNDLAWAQVRNDTVAPTKFLKIDERMGLLEHHVIKLITWAESLKEVPVEP